MGNDLRAMISRLGAHYSALGYLNHKSLRGHYFEASTLEVIDHFATLRLLSQGILLNSMHASRFMIHLSNDTYFNSVFPSWSANSSTSASFFCETVLFSS